MMSANSRSREYTKENFYPSSEHRTRRWLYLEIWASGRPTIARHGGSMVNQVYKSPNRSGVCQGTIRINTQSTRCFFLAICPMRLDTLVFGTSFCIKRAQISLIKFHFSSTAGTMNLIISRADGTRTHREERRICTVGTILVASAASCLTRSSTHQRKAPRKTGLASRSGTFTSSRSTRKLISIPYRRHNTPSYGRSSKLNSIEPRRRG
mmetsp:Transcript_6787/g.20313  ORF Transcript_6787/g.20313 Transcript_6787/m.20313 type:complete len:209 (+) Transcript_6787:1081-1707(+)